MRTMLFTPGNHPHRITKALTTLPTDAVILDLEDAVASDQKISTRAPIAAALSQPRTPRLYVRINDASTPFFFGDLEAVVQPGLDGIMLPKTADPEQVYLADAYLTHLERERALPAKSIELMPLIENATGAASLRRLCRLAKQTQRVKQIGFGATDFTNDIGATWTEDESQLLFVSSQMVLYSREAGLDPPIDSVYPLFRDHEGYETRCRRSRALGFGGRMCIHPDQLEPTNRLYAPTEDEIAWANDVIAAFEQAEANGIAALTVRGQLVDYAFVTRAHQILTRASAGPGSSLANGGRGSSLAGGPGAERAQRARTPENQLGGSGGAQRPPASGAI